MYYFVILQIWKYRRWKIAPVLQVASAANIDRGIGQESTRRVFPKGTETVTSGDRYVGGLGSNEKRSDGAHLVLQPTSEREAHYTAYCSKKTRSASPDLAQRDETVTDESDVETVDGNLITGSLTEKAEASNVLLTGNK
jgi:hypothetical protein